MKAGEALKAGRCPSAMIEEAGARLGDVKLLVDEIADWGLDDASGYISQQARIVTDALAVADHDYRRAVEALRMRAAV